MLIVLVAYAAFCIIGGFTVAASGTKIIFTFSHRPVTVHDPVMRVISVSLLIAVVIPLSIIGLPFHILLKLVGRRGFYNRQTNNWTPFGPGSLGRNR